MNFWQFLWHNFTHFFRRLFGYPEDGDHLIFPLETGVVRSLQDLAEQQQRPEDQVAADLLQYALSQYDTREYLLARWGMLTEREQQVALLIFQGYTDRQISAHLHIAYETARSHVRHVLNKFGVRRKSDLRYYLTGLDFNPHKTDQD